MRTYFLTTQRIGFSQWTAQDGALAEALWGNPEVTRYLCASGRFDAEAVGNRLALETENQRRYGAQYWPIFRLADGAFLGCCGLRPAQEPGVWELGYHLLPAYWGAGLATEAAGAALGYALRDLRAADLIAGRHPENAASGKVLEKLGFHRIGDRFYPPTGLWHAAYRYRAPDEGAGRADGTGIAEGADLTDAANRTNRPPTPT